MQETKDGPFSIMDRHHGDGDGAIIRTQFIPRVDSLFRAPGLAAAIESQVRLLPNIGKSRSDAVRLELRFVAGTRKSRTVTRQFWRAHSHDNHSIG